MAVTKSTPTVRYVTDSKGKKTDVLVPLATWEALLASWKQLIGLLEEREDRASLKQWLQERADGSLETIGLDELERELIADGLLRGAAQFSRRLA
jgi:hypothetical protein